MAPSYTTCRVVNRRGVQCTGEAVEADAELKICARHLAEALRLLKDRGAVRATGPRTQAS